MHDMKVQMVMGAEEARVIGVALQLLIDQVSKDIEDNEDDTEQSRKAFMAMLSTKFVAEGMHANIWKMLDMATGIMEHAEDDEEFTNGQH